MPMQPLNDRVRANVAHAQAANVLTNASWWLLEPSKEKQLGMPENRIWFSTKNY